MTGIYVLTCARRHNVAPWDYLVRTLEAVDRENLRNPKHVIVDGTADECALVEGMAPGWAVHRYARPTVGTWIGGNKWPYWELFRVAHEEGGDCLALEDDLAFCQSAIERMVSLTIPGDVDALQFFSAWLFGETSVPHPTPGLWRTPAMVQGCQAIKFSEDAIDRLCNWAAFDAEWQKYNESDVALGLAQQRIGLRFANHMPDLVQHAGAVSAVSHGMNVEAGLGEDPTAIEYANHTLRGRVSANWPGPKFDAMRLFGRPELYR